VKDGAGVSQTFCRGTDGTNMISAVNLLDSAGGNFAAITSGNALKVDGSAVTQPINLAQVNGNTVATAGGGIQKISIVDSSAGNINTSSGHLEDNIFGNAGGVLDFAGQNVAQPANALLTGCAFNTTPTTVTSGNATQLQCTSAARLIVDGSQVTQPVSGTVSINAIPTGSNTIGAVTQASGPWTINLTQVAGSTLGAIANYGTSPGAVLVPGVNAFITNTPAVSQSGTWNVGLNAGSNTVGKVDILGNAGATLDATVAAGAAPTNGIATLGQFNTTAPAPTNGQTVALQVSGVGNLMVEQGCAGQTMANTKIKVINNAGSSSNLLLVTGTASKNTYICGINIGPIGTATNVALVEGTTTTNPCDTSTAGMDGGATAATGWNIPAGGGLTYGNGVGVLTKTATAADNVCLLFSAANQVNGVITYAVGP
jgi:hypothetical protein